jgi:hypothetical protein
MLGLSLWIVRCGCVMLLLLLLLPLAEMEL